MALCQTSVLKLYNTVIEDVISSVRDAFLDEGVDEQVLQEMKQVWTNKLMASKAIELNKDQPDPQPPPLVATSQKSGAIKKKIMTCKLSATLILMEVAFFYYYICIFFSTTYK